MAQQKEYQVTIAEESYILRSDRPEEEVKRVIQLVQQRINQAASFRNRYNKVLQAMLAAVNLADEALLLEDQLQDLPALKEEVTKLKAQLKESKQTLAKTRTDLAQVNQQLSKTQKELAQARSELDQLKQPSPPFASRQDQAKQRKKK